MVENTCPRTLLGQQNLPNFRPRAEQQNNGNRSINPSNVSNFINTLNIQQINLHHCVAAVQNFDFNFNKKQIEGFRKNEEYIGLIQEPYVKFGRISGFSSNYKIICSSTKKNVRACIAVSKKLRFWTLSQYTNEDQVAIIVNTNNKKVVLVSLYMPGDSTEAPPPTIFRNLVKYCDENNLGLVVGTDANSHHTAWGSTDINER